jgi:thiol-disulfide isomerase/thioredoxin
MSLATMEPNPVWDATSHEDAVETLAALGDDATIHVWGADWCGDCRAVLPDVAAALDAAGLRERVSHHAVDREKKGELVGEYGVEYIPTIVVEVGGEERARFVESEPVPAAVFLAEQLDDR